MYQHDRMRMIGVHMDAWEQDLASMDTDNAYGLLNLGDELRCRRRGGCLII